MQLSDLTLFDAFIWVKGVLIMSNYHSYQTWVLSGPSGSLMPAPLLSVEN
jgi:hypothetical protein